MMKQAWLVRPNPHGINRVEEFLSKGIVAIGWSGIGSLDCRSRENIKRILAGKPYEYSGYELGQATGSVDRFANSVQIGDLVVSPDGDNIYFGVVTSSYIFDPAYDSMEVGYSHQRKVEWKNKVLRANLSDELRASFRYDGTIVELTKLYSEIEALCKA